MTFDRTNKGNKVSFVATFLKTLPIFALLVGCSSMNVSPPAQPTPASIESTVTALQGITSDPVTAWQAGEYATQAACDAYLNESAERSANINTASAGIGIVGAGVSAINPIAGVTSSLIQTLLSAYQSNGALPYSAETTALIQNTMVAYENAVPTPQTVAEAAMDVEGLFWQCSPAGYAENASKAIGTATVSAGGLAIPNAEFATPSVPHVGPPVITVNGR